MSYIGSIGSLIAGTGMQEVLEKVFGSVIKLLSGKIYPQCVRALRLLIKELLRPILQDERINSHNMLQEYLTEKSEKSRDIKLWAPVLINPLFLALQFISAEPEGDWLLHSDTAGSMLPLFYAASPNNYARDGLY